MDSKIRVLSNGPFFEKLKRQTNETLCRIVRANYNTQFARAASELAEFCRATTSDLVSEMDDDILSGVFRKTVHLTTYDAYAPFTTKLFEKPCKASSIRDLLAPGLPDYLANSSSTSGALPKHFPKYNCPRTTVASKDAGLWTESDPNRKRTVARVQYLGTGQMSVEDDEGCLVQKIYSGSMSIVVARGELKLDPECDEEKMATFILDQAAPYAAAFIKKWRSFLLIQVLFALASRSVESFLMIFANTFVDMMHHLDVEFDTIVDCIENGTIPRLDGVEEVRRYLEPNLLPDPERAAELRNLGCPSSRPGWCSLVWPRLHKIIAITSGPFASYVPLVRWYLSPDTDVGFGNYGCTEFPKVGLPYDSRDADYFKVTDKIVVELLDIEKNSDSISALAQLWEVEVGKRYEIVITTSDGLWRYRIGDVVEVAGFDPTDGVPIIKFVERRNVAMRFHNFMLSEKELRAAMSSAISSMPLVNVADWTATIDDRQAPSTIGFFLELAGNEVSDLVLSSPDRVLDALLQLNSNVSSALAVGWFRKPTIRLVRPGTFSDFQQLKLDEGSRNIGQIKVPVVLPKPEYVTWFSDQVVREL